MVQSRTREVAMKQIGKITETIWGRTYVEANERLKSYKLGIECYVSYCKRIHDAHTCNASAYKVRYNVTLVI